MATDAREFWSYERADEAGQNELDGSWDYEVVECVSVLPRRWLVRIINPDSGIAHGWLPKR